MNVDIPYRQELWTKGALDRDWFKFFDALNRRTYPPWALVDTAANRANYPAANYPPGALYFESDTGLVYVVMPDVGAGQYWRYLSGTVTGTLSPNTLPAGLGTNDAGLQFEATDFQRMYAWNGSAWSRAVGEPVVGSLGLFTVSAPPGWRACTGGTASASTNTGGTTTVAIPDMTGYFIKGGAYTGIPNPAVGATLLGALGPPTATTLVTAGGVGVASSLHSHTLGTLHNDDDGEPQSFDVLICFRL